jgi:3-oxoacyl-[acyl-carrier protein] reductase
VQRRRSVPTRRSIRLLKVRKAVFRPRETLEARDAWTHKLSVVPKDLQARVSLVTGAGRGVGRAVARALAAEGSPVALVARSLRDLEGTRGEIEAAGGVAIVAKADVTDGAGVEWAVAEVQDALGPIEILVNNAGRCRALGPTHRVSAEEWAGDVETNLIGTFLVTRAVLPGMLERGRGRIVNVSSFAATRPSPYMSAYGSAKAALVHFTCSLAEEVREQGVSVFAMTPGTVKTEMTAFLTESEAGQHWFPPIPEERWVPIEQAGRLAVFLASGRADELSGRFLHVLDDIEDLVGRAAEVRQEDLYTLRLRTYQG